MLSMVGGGTLIVDTKTSLSSSLMVTMLWRLVLVVVHYGKDQNKDYNMENCTPITKRAPVATYRPRDADIPPPPKVETGFRIRRI